ncbi:MAG: class I SAM-dependent methyltransferase [Halioglobus sp.]
MLTLTHASFATTEQLFLYKEDGFQLKEFPGYTPDQWGIKAHNRPWIDATGSFARGQSAIEVGGAYSRLPEYLQENYGVEAWIGDDFGMDEEEGIWSRWGKPQDLPDKYPSVNYVFEPFGKYDEKYPSRYFDRIFSVSTLEHIPLDKRLDVFKDMNRCLKPGGRQLHTIDIDTSWKKLLLSSVVDCIPGISRLAWAGQSEVRSWLNIMRQSGIKIPFSIPRPWELFNRELLVESPDVVYRFYPPIDQVKPYSPTASLLIVIDDI